MFSVALLIPEQVKTWGKELLPVGLVRQARGGDTVDRRRRLLWIVLMLTLLTGLGVAIYVAAAPVIFHLLFPNYPDAVLPTRIAALTLLALPSSLFLQYLEAQGLLHELSISHWISAAVFVLSLLLLVPTLGIVGAVLARGCLRLSYVGCSTWFLMQPPQSPLPPHP